MADPPPETAEPPAEGEEPKPEEGAEGADAAAGADGAEPAAADAPAEGGEAPAEIGEAPAEGDAPDGGGDAPEVKAGAADIKEPPDTGVRERIEKDPLELEFLKPLPEQIAFHTIPKINDARSVWRIGMRKLEETFAEHIANMHLDFEDKAMKYEQIQHQIEANMRFMEQFYVDMQNKMNEKYALIKIERDAWEEEKDIIKNLVNLGGEVVSLNIGGNVHIQTEKSVLQSVPQSLLAKMFSEMHELKKIDDEVFLDRDGRTFETLVNYLRNDRKVFPEFSDKNQENHFFKELHFWGIDSHNRGWQEQYLKKLDKSVRLDPRNTSFDSPQEVQMEPEQRSPTVVKSKRPLYMAYDNLDDNDSRASRGEEPSYMYRANSAGIGSDDDDQPGAALKAVKEKWTELGPLKLEDIIANSSEPIDQSLQFGQSRFNKYIIGQIGADGRVQGVGKEINHIIYEGQFKNDIYHGYGRYIYSNGNYYLGNWVDGKRSGWGKLVDKSGKVYEGMWQYSKFIGS